LLHVQGPTKNIKAMGDYLRAEVITSARMNRLKGKMIFSTPFKALEKDI
jgi:hypothetical protein